MFRVLTVLGVLLAVAGCGGGGGGTSEVSVSKSRPAASGSLKDSTTKTSRAIATH